EKRRMLKTSAAGTAARAGEQCRGHARRRSLRLGRAQAAARRAVLEAESPPDAASPVCARAHAGQGSALPTIGRVFPGRRRATCSWRSFHALVKRRGPWLRRERAARRRARARWRTRKEEPMVRSHSPAGLARRRSLLGALAAAGALLAAPAVASAGDEF